MYFGTLKLSCATTLLFSPCTGLRRGNGQQKAKERKGLWTNWVRQRSRPLQLLLLPSDQL